MIFCSQVYCGDTLFKLVLHGITQVWLVLVSFALIYINKRRILSNFY